MIGVIATGGKQYIVAVGQKIKIEKIAAKAGDIVDFKNILDATNLIKGKVLAQGMGKKVSMIKYKNKSRYIKRIGHRQPYTAVEITAVGSETIEALAPKAKENSKKSVSESKAVKKTGSKKKTLIKSAK